MGKTNNGVPFKFGDGQEAVFFLDRFMGSLVVRARLIGKNSDWYVLRISEKGVDLFPDLSENLGLPIDGEGRIRMEEVEEMPF